MNRKTITVLCCILALLVAVGSTFGIASCIRNLTNESEEIKPPKKEAKHVMSGYKLVKSGVSEYKILLSNKYSILYEQLLTFVKKSKKFPSYSIIISSFLLEI